MRGTIKTAKPERCPEDFRANEREKGNISADKASEGRSGTIKTAKPERCPEDFRANEREKGNISADKASEGRSGTINRKDL